MIDEQGRYKGKFDADKYWRRHSKPCKYVEGYRCITDHCTGCMWNKESGNDRRRNQSI